MWKDKTGSSSSLSLHGNIKSGSKLTRYLLLILLLLLWGRCDSTFVAECIDDNGKIHRIDEKFYDDLIWRMNIDTTKPVMRNLTIVNMCRDRNVFDYCNLENYTTKGIESMLKMHHIDTNLPPAERQWVAYFGKELALECQPETWIDSFKMYWYQALSIHIQKMGAEGYLYVGAQLYMLKFMKISYVDNVKGYVDGGGANKGTVKIFGGYYVGDYPKLDTVLQCSLDQNRSLIADQFISDTNPLDIAITDKASLYKILCYVLGVLAGISLLDSLQVTWKYLLIKDFSLPSNYCTYTLMLTIVGNCIRLMLSIDPNGFYQSFYCIFVRVLYTFNVTLAISSSLGTLFYWIEVLAQLSFHLNFTVMKKVNSHMQNFFVLLSVLIAAFDIWISIYGHFGRVAGIVVIVPALMYLSLYLGLAVFNFVIVFWLLRSVKRIRTTVATDRSKAPTQSEARPSEISTSGASKPNKVTPSGGDAEKKSVGGEKPDQLRTNNELREKKGELLQRIMKRLLVASQYSILAGLFMLLEVVLCLAAASNYQYTSPQNLGIVFIGIPIATQGLAWCELRILSVAMEKINPDKKE